ncbi:hypothetical protein AB8U03_00050 [Clostridium sp. Mt-5]|uniref:Uncharacterized protein n=1 Tax=Clostridium moutaii TaxID=3240932 RepID=A0ABV4BKM6_9CLOT
MDISRLNGFNVQFLYSDGIDTGSVITNYKPPRPAYFRKGIRTISGYTQFQENIKSDCIVECTLSFQIKGDTDAETQANAQKYLTFLSRCTERFTLINEFGVTYKGYIQEKFDPDTPIEGDIYYIAIQLLCNHDISGWVSDDNGL